MSLQHDLSKRIKDFLSFAKLEQMPHQLPLTRIDINVFENQCLFNCFNACEQYGWTTEFGWVVNDYGNNYTEAVFHGVCRDNSQLIDITPLSGREKYAMFIPDPHRRGIRISETKWATWTNILWRQDGVFVDCEPTICDEWYPPQIDEAML